MCEVPVDFVIRGRPWLAKRAAVEGDRAAARLECAAVDRGRPGVGIVAREGQRSRAVGRAEKLAAARARLDQPAIGHLAIDDLPAEHERAITPRLGPFVGWHEHAIPAPRRMRRGRLSLLLLAGLCPEREPRALRHAFLKPLARLAFAA